MRCLNGRGLILTGMDRYLPGWSSMDRIVCSLRSRPGTEDQYQAFWTEKHWLLFTVYS